MSEQPMPAKPFAATFQTFEDAAHRAHVPGRVMALRGELKRLGLDGFVIPRADRHQNEYVPACEERLAFISGFTGSAGAAVVLMNKAAMFVDGRYTEQVRAQVDTGIFAIESLIDLPPDQWLKAHLSAGDCLGYDPWLTTKGGLEKLEAACRDAGAFLLAVESNPVDSVWKERPAPPCAPVVLHDLSLAGKASGDKLSDVRAALTREKVDSLIVSDPHALAWLFNIRGGDVGHTPLPLGDAIVPREGRPLVFLDGRKLSNAVRDALADLAEITEPKLFAAAVSRFGEGGATVRLDSATAPAKLAALVEAGGGNVSVGTDPIALMKAQKNAAELAGARAAHVRDGAAFLRFLAWFDAQAPGTLTEIAVVEALESFRRATGALKDVSFPTIAGSGPNGALPHYRVSRASDRVMRLGELLVLDSGGQYVDGTTDITRTLAIGEPAAEERDRNTRVLKGHLAIGRALFPSGTTGAQLDTLARQFLWEAGLDFDHGTGHGVGSYLSVHEGPQRISRVGTTALKRGMILSNEPGYYKAGAYGIRIENLIAVMQAPPIAEAERPLDAFETLTLAPYDRSLIAPDLLTPQERAQIDAYHARVRTELSAHLDAATRAFLDHQTRPLD
jgi:Xaa-Pro aminopeptidase